MLREHSEYIRDKVQALGDRQQKDSKQVKKFIKDFDAHVTWTADATGRLEKALASNFSIQSYSSSLSDVAPNMPKAVHDEAIKEDAAKNPVVASEDILCAVAASPF